MRRGRSGLGGSGEGGVEGLGEGGGVEEGRPESVKGVVVPRPRLRSSPPGTPSRRRPKRSRASAGSARGAPRRVPFRQ